MKDEHVTQLVNAVEYWGRKAQRLEAERDALAEEYARAADQLARLKAMVERETRGAAVLVN